MSKERLIEELIYKELGVEVELGVLNWWRNTLLVGTETVTQSAVISHEYLDYILAVGLPKNDEELALACMCVSDLNISHSKFMRFLDEIKSQA